MPAKRIEPVMQAVELAPLATLPPLDRRGVSAYRAPIVMPPLAELFPFSWMIANPAMSHATTAVIETACIAGVGIALRAPRPAATAAIIVSTYYYGRESGQREHDLRRMGVEPVSAHLGAAFMAGWSRGNVEQWVAPTISAWAVAAVVILIQRRRRRGG